MRRMLLLLFPELERFPSRAAEQEARATAHRKYRGNVFIVFWIVPGCAVLLLAHSYILPRSGISHKAQGYVYILLLVVVLLLGIIGSFMPYRRKVRLSLRRQLVDQGVPICIPCGYNLTGNVSGVCPECSTVVEGASQPESDGATSEIEP